MFLIKRCEKRCPTCFKIFTPTCNRQVHCSEKCNNANSYNNYKTKKLTPVIAELYHKFKGNFDLICDELEDRKYGHLRTMAVKQIVDGLKVAK